MYFEIEDIILQKYGGRDHIFTNYTTGSLPISNYKSSTVYLKKNIFGYSKIFHMVNSKNWQKNLITAVHELLVVIAPKNVFLWGDYRRTEEVKIKSRQKYYFL